MTRLAFVAFSDYIFFTLSIVGVERNGSIHPSPEFPEAPFVLFYLFSLRFFIYLFLLLVRDREFRTSVTRFAFFFEISTINLKWDSRIVKQNINRTITDEEK